jgi:NAD(P)-dependent dehydrogenase (short-subunit alcohol dehydrogenase family)
MGSLEGKIVLVTGASRGIGAGIARRFGAEGAMVIVTARTLTGQGRDYGGQALPGSVEETVAQIEDSGARAIGLHCDVADPASRAALAEAVVARFGGIDILVNNATASGGARYDVITTEQYDRVFQINVQGVLDLIQRFAPGMVARGGGAILNLTSRAAEHPPGPPYAPLYRTGGMILYGAAKAALNRLTTGLAAELDGTGVVVNALAPNSVVWTPGAAASGLEKYRSSPDWKEEPVEGMAEAALALCTATPPVTGLCVYSTDYLTATGRAIRTLDGRSLLENWTPRVD